MNGHAMSRSSLSSYEESISLLDEKSLSDIESEAGRAENNTRFPAALDWARAGKGAITGPPLLLTRIPSRAHCGTLMLKAALFFLPSFVSARLTHQYERPSSPHRLGPTAYLDGMRGLAAFVVFFCHYFYTSFIIADGWGSNDANYDIMKLPFLRLTYAGPPMVAIFFIVSGYALSLKPLKLARSQKWADFTTTMSSFVFRRAFRLFLPTFASTLLIVTLLRVGAYEWNRDFSKNPQFHWNVQEIAPDRKETLSVQLTDWYWNMFNFVHVWGWEKFGGSTYYDVHLWTIPIEFRASMMLFLTLVAFARLRVAWRLGCLALVTAFSYRSDRWEMVLFYTGMLYAELDIIRGAHTDPATNAALQLTHQQGSSNSLPTDESKPIDYVGTGPSTPAWKQRGPLAKMGWAVLSTIALFLLGQPDVNSERTPGWVTLSTYIPVWVDDKYRYFQCIGAMLFVFCTTRVPALQRVFNSAPVQYLGKISYAIYLMHGPVLHTVGYSIERVAWGITGTEGRWFVVGFALAALGVVPSVIWAADVFWRVVDAPVVRFAKWVEGKCVVVSEERGYGRA